MTPPRKGGADMRPPLEYSIQEAAERELCRLMEMFGAENVFVEVTDHGDPLDGDRNEALTGLAARHGLKVVATNNVHYHAPAKRRLATITAAFSGCIDVHPQ